MFHGANGMASDAKPSVTSRDTSRHNPPALDRKLASFCNELRSPQSSQGTHDIAMHQRQPVRRFMGALRPSDLRCPAVMYKLAQIEPLPADFVLMGRCAAFVAAPMAAFCSCANGRRDSSPGGQITSCSRRPERSVSHINLPDCLFQGPVDLHCSEHIAWAQESSALTTKHHRQATGNRPSTLMTSRITMKASMCTP
jgi:hypothetical protein